MAAKRGQRGWCLSFSWSKQGGVSWFWHFPASDFHETFTKSSLALIMSKKLLSDPYLAIHSKLMAKNGHLFIDHLYVPNGKTWGSTSKPHIGDVVMSLFSLWSRPFMTSMVQKWYVLDQKRPNMVGLSTLQKWSKRVRKGAK